jgi:hypothetical protein
LKAELAMSDIFSTLSSAYAASTSSSLFSLGSKFSNVDPTQWQGTWTGKDTGNQSYTISISNVKGYRADVIYKGSQGFQSARVFISNQNSFRIGDSKFVLNGSGTATLASVVTSPYNGAQTVEQSTATLQT